MFSLHFSTTSAAFSYDGEPDSDHNHVEASEISRILCDVADQVYAGRRSGPCTDSNGNTMGNWSLEP
jgi:hypothetical protein